MEPTLAQLEEHMTVVVSKIVIMWSLVRVQQVGIYDINIIYIIIII